MQTCDRWFVGFAIRLSTNLKFNPARESPDPQKKTRYLIGLHDSLGPLQVLVDPHKEGQALLHEIGLNNGELLVELPSESFIGIVACSDEGLKLLRVPNVQVPFIGHQLEMRGLLLSWSRVTELERIPTVEHNVRRDPLVCDVDVQPALLRCCELAPLLLLGQHRTGLQELIQGREVAMAVASRAQTLQGLRVHDRVLWHVLVLRAFAVAQAGT